MKPWLLALVLGRRPQLVEQTFTANGVLVVPASVSAVNMSGYGARGVDGSSGRVTQYTRSENYYNVRRSDGGYEQVGQRSGVQASGTKPSADYCDPLVPITGTIYSAGQICYYNFVDNSYNFNNPATRGASATGIGKTFLGSLGNVAQTPVPFTNVAVTPGASYNIVVPTGGSVTISYYV
jgi:hypothetical protein